MDPERKPADTEPAEAAYESDGQEPDSEEPLGRDERVSLYPLSFEEVVRALQKTPRTRSDDEGSPKA